MDALLTLYDVAAPFFLAPSVQIPIAINSGRHPGAAAQLPLRASFPPYRDYDLSIRLALLSEVLIFETKIIFNINLCLFIQQMVYRPHV
jgi:hypothetical protein